MWMQAKSLPMTSHQPGQIRLMRGSISRQYIDWIKNDMEMLGICHSFLQLLQRF